LKAYVGIKENAKPVVLELDSEPTKETRAQYNVLYGPFKSREDAEKYVKEMGELACGDS
jgi:hypothetical protein